ncbi:MAG: TetR/AcrR family transcriptional regulator [Campylobacterales bacterium]|nr:TetR/AcrR family transcriptional regulator [Campylobacterales bacterium]
MSPKIVSVEGKRDDIISKAMEFIEEQGIEKFSTGSFIKHFKIGKSSLYHYFKSKDEILYEIYYKIVMEDIEKSREKIKINMSIEEKMDIIFDFYLASDSVNKKVQKIYKEFLHISSEKKIDKLQEYDEKLLKATRDLISEVFEYEIENREFSPLSLDMINSIIVTSDGMLLYSFSVDSFDLSYEFRKYLDTTLKLFKGCKES